eukprot:12745115-Prorocentrum_lima.AAC.1
MRLNNKRKKKESRVGFEASLKRAPGKTRSTTTRTLCGKRQHNDDTNARGISTQVCEFAR